MNATGKIQQIAELHAKGLC